MKCLIRAAIKGMITHLGKHVRLPSCTELTEKIDTTLMSVLVTKNALRTLVRCCRFELLPSSHRHNQLICGAHWSRLLLGG